MARAGKAQISGDIWHLSIDDLLGAPAEPACLADRGPFVINLSTSTASIGPPPKGLQRFDGLHLYQLRRVEEGQPRFLLRLGIFATEADADAMLARMLEHYPGATKNSAEDDDRAAIAASARPADSPKPVQQGRPERPPQDRQSRPIAAPPAPKVAAVVVDEADYDPNAITLEAEMPTFTFDASEVEATVATTAKPDARNDATLPVGSRALNPITNQAPPIDAVEEPTVEVRALTAESADFP